MDPTEPLIERGEVSILDNWWFSAGLGSIVFGVAIAIGMNSPPGPPGPLATALCTFGLTVGFLDGFGSGRVISYGTMRGPEQRTDEAEARFYAWGRASKRYALAAGLSLVSAVGVTVATTDDFRFVAFMSGYALYMPVWAFDLYRSLHEAKKLFPPPK